jgi:hypothetical protein
MKSRLPLLLLFIVSCGAHAAPSSRTPLEFRTARSGAWSSPDTWESGAVPGAGAIVRIGSPHDVTYDLLSDVPIRFLHVAGSLTFARDRDTRLDVGILKIEGGHHATENGAECDSHAMHARGRRPSLEVGTSDAPIPAGITATIRLVPFSDQNPDDAPSILNCGGRMDFHGAPLVRTWVKLASSTYAGSDSVLVADDLGGWRPGDRVLLTTTAFVGFFEERPGGGRRIRDLLDGSETEVAHVREVAGRELRLDRALRFEHFADENYRGEVANLSRNVVVESAAPDGIRGHTMYHHGSTGSISYAEFRHLGKAGVLARYPIHFHLVRDTMRGSAVIGASVWDSANRFVTIHGTDYIVVRDTVGYGSLGHGFFLEDGSEVYNVFDRNLAVQARLTAPLPEQALPTDLNDGAGFWWANSLNAFTRNVAVECDTHGYRYQISDEGGNAVVFDVRQPDGTRRPVDVRTLPFLRFADNEAHSQRRFSLNLGGFNGLADNRDIDRDGNVLDRAKFLGGAVGGVGPDDRHPFVIERFSAWRSHWGFHSGAPNVRFDGFKAFDLAYVVWRSNLAGHEYNNLDFRRVDVSSFFFNWGDTNTQYDVMRYLPRTDTQPPVTVITRIERVAPQLLLVSGVAVDDTGVASVTVNDRPAELGPGPTHDFRVLVPARARGFAVEAGAVDTEGNREITPHRLVSRDTLANARSVATRLAGFETAPIATRAPEPAAIAEARTAIPAAESGSVCLARARARDERGAAPGRHRALADARSGGRLRDGKSGRRARTLGRRRTAPTGAALGAVLSRRPRDHPSRVSSGDGAEPEPLPRRRSTGRAGVVARRGRVHAPRGPGSAPAHRGRVGARVSRWYSHRVRERELGGRAPRCRLDRKRRGDDP